MNSCRPDRWAVRALAPAEQASAEIDRHGLKGERKGTFAVDASGNWRITFRWDRNDAVDVDLEDYH